MASSKEERKKIQTIICGSFGLSTKEERASVVNVSLVKSLIINLTGEFNAALFKFAHNASHSHGNFSCLAGKKGGFALSTSDMYN